MPRRRIHGEHSLLNRPHPAPRYAERVQLIRWRRGPTNPTWEARVRLPDGTWTRPFSLGTEDDMEAAVNAAEELTKREQLHLNGLPQPTRTPKPEPQRNTETFGDAARAAIERLSSLRDETLLREGRQKAHKWMRAYRTPDGNLPAQNTVGNFNHSFQFVMQVAAERGWLREDDIPSISKKGFRTR